MFFVGVLLLTIAALLVIQKVSPYLAPGVRVEYSENSYWKEFQMMPVRADARAVYVKKIDGQSLAASLWPVTHTNSMGSGVSEETYVFPKGTEFTTLIVRRSADNAIRLMSVATRRGMSVPLFEDGILLTDGSYSIASKDTTTVRQTFTVSESTMYLNVIK